MTMWLCQYMCAILIDYVNIKCYTLFKLLVRRCNINLKNRIKELRNTLHLSQTDFGAKVGVKGNTIGNYEIGLRNPSDAVIFSICREFDVNEQWLRTGEGEMFVVKTRDEEIASFIGSLLKKNDDTFQKRLISVLSKLEESDWEVLEKMCYLMLESKKD